MKRVVLCDPLVGGRITVDSVASKLGDAGCLS